MTPDNASEPRRQMSYEEGLSEVEKAIRAMLDSVSLTDHARRRIQELKEELTVAKERTVSLSHNVTMLSERLATSRKRLEDAEQAHAIQADGYIKRINDLTAKLEAAEKANEILLASLKEKTNSTKHPQVVLEHESKSAVTPVATPEPHSGARFMQEYRRSKIASDAKPQQNNSEVVMRYAVPLMPGFAHDAHLIVVGEFAPVVGAVHNDNFRAASVCREDGDDRQTVAYLLRRETRSSYEYGIAMATPQGWSTVQIDGSGGPSTALHVAFHAHTFPCATPESALRLAGLLLPHSLRLK